MLRIKILVKKRKIIHNKDYQNNIKNKKKIKKKQRL